MPAIAGAGGTLLVLLAQSLPSPWNSWLLYAAPALSVIASVVFTPIWQRWLRKQNQRELGRALEQAKDKLMRLLQNDQTSARHKQKLRRDLERIEKIEVAVQLGHIVALSSVAHSLDRKHVHTIVAQASDLQTEEDEKTDPLTEAGSVDKKHARALAAHAGKPQTQSDEKSETANEAVTDPNQKTSAHHQHGASE